MSMNDYITIVNNTSQTPNQQMRGLEQAYVDAQWDDTSLLCTVQEETQRGSFEFYDISCQRLTITNFTTNSLKDEKNYRQLFFQDCAHEVDRGRFYKWENNYYLTYEGTTLIDPLSDVCVRRCNNVAKWIDPDTNILHELPCILEYEDSSPKERIDKDVNTPSNVVVLVMQGNEDTIKFKQNQRFIFNGRPFKIDGYNNYMQDDYVTKSTPLLFFDIYLDEILPVDDMVNQIANAGDYVYDVNILETPTDNVNGYTNSLTAQVTLNGNITTDKVTWTSNSYGTIDSNGTYVLNGSNGDVAMFTATFGQSSDSVSINIVTDISDYSEIVVSPDITELKQGRSVTLTANKYTNGTKQNDTVIATLSGTDSENYSWSIGENNTFTLSNIYKSTVPLTIIFSTGTLSKTISVELTSII